MYRPKTWTRLASEACPIIACSNDVIGPDSFASVDMSPVSANTIEHHERIGQRERRPDDAERDQQTV